TAAGSRLFFAAEDDVHGIELRLVDDSASQPRLVQDLAPGQLSSAPEALAVVDGTLYFSADDGVHGREPWALAIAGQRVCVSSDTRLCLVGGRYAVEATWRDFSGRTGPAHTHPLSDGT